MALLRSMTVLFLLMTAWIVAMCRGTHPESSTMAASATIAEHPTILRTGHESPVQEPDDQDLNHSVGEHPTFARIPTEQIVQDYYAETLSVVPALMFSPEALRLAFVQTVDLPIDEHGNTLLHVASRSGDVFATWQLLELGANSGIENRFRERPADIVYRGNAQISQSLSAAFLSNRDAMATVLFRRSGWNAPAESRTSPAAKARGNTKPAGITMGLITG